MISDIFDALCLSPILEGVQQRLGGEFIDENTAAERIVWVPTTDRFRSGRIQAGLAVNDRTKPPSVATRVAGVKCRCWAKAVTAGNVADTVEEVRACEELARKLIIAVHDVAYGSFQCQGLVWTDQDGAPLIQFGRCVDVLFSFEIPIFRRPSEANLTATPAEMIAGTGLTAAEVVVQSLLEPVSLATLPGATSAELGEPIQFTAWATYSDGAERWVDNVVWMSGDESVFTVSPEGVVTSLNPGASYLSALFRGLYSQPVLVTIT